MKHMTLGDIEELLTDISKPPKEHLMSVVIKILSHHSFKTINPERWILRVYLVFCISAI